MSNIFVRYFNYIYDESRKERHRNEVRFVDEFPAALLLDLGCREGDNTLAISKKIGTTKIIGVDYNQKNLSLAHQKGIRAIRSDLNCPFPLKDNEVDIVFASNVIEHLYSTQLFIREVYRVLKPGGYLVLDTPNLASWHNIFALLIGFQPFSGPNLTNMEDADLTLVRSLHRIDHSLPEQGKNVEHDEQELTRHIVVIAYRSLIKMIKENGFTIVKAKGFGYYPFPPIIAKLFQRVDIAHAHHISVKAIKIIPGMHE